jgi:putative inorganic carbon (HCO3(-)) transporter
MVLYFSAIIVFLTSVCWRPSIGIFYIVPLFPLQTIRYRMHEFPFGDKLIDITLLGVFLGLLFRHKFRLKSPLTGLLVVFVFFLYISLWQGAFFLNTDWPLSLTDPRFSDWKNYMIMPFVFFLALSVIKDVKQMKWLVLLLCISTLLVNKTFYSDVISRGVSHYSEDIRDGAAFGYAGANGIGAFEAWFAVFLLALYGSQRKKYLKIAIVGLFLFCVYCLMFTFSRGAYAGILVAVTFLAIVQKRKLLLILIPFLLTWQAIVPQSVQERVLMTYDPSEHQLESSAAERVNIWEDAANLIHENPIVGTGFNTYAYMHRVGPYSDTHNYFLKVLVETGAVGLLLFLWLLSKMWRCGWTLFRNAVDPFLKSIGLGFAAAIMAEIVTNLFGDRWMYIQINGFLWTLLACMVKGMELTQESAQQQATAVAGAGMLPEEMPQPVVADAV